MIKNILISQSTPANMAPYEALSQQFRVNFTFRPFYRIEPLTKSEFWTQKVNIQDYSSIVFLARNTIDGFFNICKELRIKMPAETKYFCSSEAVAVYLQKHIVFRKRKVFYGQGTADSLLSQIVPKFKDEKILIAKSESNNGEAITTLFDKAGLAYGTADFVKAVPQDLSSVNIADYDMLVFYNPSDVTSLKVNFPDYKVGTNLFLTYGRHIVEAMGDAGLPIEIAAPSEEAHSVAKALELYLKAHA